MGSESEPTSCRPARFSQVIASRDVDVLTCRTADDHHAVVFLRGSHEPAVRRTDVGRAAPALPAEACVEAPLPCRQSAEVESLADEIRHRRHHRGAQSGALTSGSHGDGLDVAASKRARADQQFAFHDGGVGDDESRPFDERVPSAKCMAPVVVAEIAFECLVEQPANRMTVRLGETSCFDEPDSRHPSIPAPPNPSAHLSGRTDCSLIRWKPAQTTGSLGGWHRQLK